MYLNSQKIKEFTLKQYSEVDENLLIDRLINRGKTVESKKYRLKKKFNFNLNELSKSITSTRIYF